MSSGSPQADRHEPVARKHDLLPVDEDPMARVCCNVLLRAYFAAEPLQWPRMVALVRCMSGAGPHMKPDIITYNTLLSGLVALHKVELAFALLDTIVRGGLHPTAATWRTLMHGAASAGAHSRCYDAWRNLLRTEGELDIDDINTAILALVELGRWHDGWQIYDTMLRNQQLEPTEQTLALLAEPLRHVPQAVGASVTAAQLIADARRFGLPLPTAAVESLVGHLCVSSRWGDAVAVVRTALHRDGRALVPVLRYLAEALQDAHAAREQAGLEASHGLEDAYQQVLMLYRAMTS